MKQNKPKISYLVLSISSLCSFVAIGFFVTIPTANAYGYNSNNRGYNLPYYNHTPTYNYAPTSHRDEPRPIPMPHQVPTPRPAPVPHPMPAPQPRPYPVSYPQYTPTYSYNVPTYQYQTPTYDYSNYYQYPSNYQTYPTVYYQQAQPSYTNYYQPAQTIAYQPTPVNYYTNSQYSIVSQNNNSLNISCFADPATTSGLNQPVNLISQVSGGTAPYTYSWSGSDNLSGTLSSIIKYYSTAGEKTAIVSVTSSDGKTGTGTCANTVAVSGAINTEDNTGTNSTTIEQIQNDQTDNGQATSSQQQGSSQDNGQLTASALASASGIPWGWIAVLIILVLFAIMMYLLFDRQKV